MHLGRGVRSKEDGDDLWTKCLCPLNIHLSKPFPRCEGGRTWGLWEVVRIR